MLVNTYYFRVSWDEELDDGEEHFDIGDCRQWVEPVYDPIDELLREVL